MTKDPWYKRELKRYEHPIASREYIISIIKKAGKPLTLETLATKLGIAESQQLALTKRLRAMELEGQLVRNRRGALGLVSQMDLRVGLVRGNKDGSGIFIAESGDASMHLSNLQMSRVFDGDRVVVSPRLRMPEGDHECVITDILKSNTQTLIGYFKRSGEIGYVEPRNRRICLRIVVKGNFVKIPERALVEVKISRQPGRHQQPEGEILQVLMPRKNPPSEIQIALMTHNLPTQWTAEVLDEVAKLADLPLAASYQDRVDLRSLSLVTIDGADSHDFDDAVYCEKQPGGNYRAIVAVADVSHYVAIDSPLDYCASERSNSVYFPREVIPMLPERLSNDLCSLKPAVDRLVLACEMTLGRTGECKDFKVYQAVMHSHARLTYDQVNELFEQPLSNPNNYSKAVLNNLRNLESCYHKLKAKRQKRGALSFEMPEYIINFSEQASQASQASLADSILGITPRYRGTAQKLIEEFMLLANSCVAKLLTDHNLPTLYRIHQQPEAQKLEKLRRFMRASMNIKLAGGNRPKPGDFAAVIEQSSKHPLGEYLLPIILRTMQQAVYSPSNQGHYGLALKFYCHFTSPIRRYPDLQVHRGLKALIATSRKRDNLHRVGKRGKAKLAELYPYSEKDMQVIGQQCSINENKANDASYDVHNWLCCTYLSGMIGKRMEGVVRSITSFGLFVSIGDTNIDGLVHISTLHNDYYHFDADSISLVGEHSRRFKLGDRFRVQLVAVDVEKGRIDLVIDDDSMPSKKTKRASKPRYHKRQHFTHSRKKPQK